MAEQSSQNVKQTVTFLPEWDGKDYAANTGHHRVHDGAFLETLPLAPTDRVLDLCCGSGDFTRTIADLVSEGHVLGLDAQPSMIDEARIRAGANQSFVTGPVQHLATLVPDDASFDVVMSRSALHWVPEADHPGLLAQCFRVLRPGGVLRLEMGGGDNVRAMRALLDGISSRLGRPDHPVDVLGCGVLPRARRGGRVLGRARLGPHRRPAPLVRPRGGDRLAREPVLPGLRGDHARGGAPRVPG